MEIEKCDYSMTLHGEVFVICVGSPIWAFFFSPPRFNYAAFVFLVSFIWR